MSHLCSICQQPIHGIFRNDWFCHSCYITYQNDILNKSAWVKFCQNFENRRRRQEKRDANTVYGLGDSLDVVKTDTGYKLIEITNGDDLRHP